MNAALTRSVVAVQSRVAGRGPTRARAFFRHDVVVVVMEDALTTAEHELVAGGRAAAVLDLRKQLQELMRAELVAAVERLTGCRVLALLSDNHIDPDVAIEVFVLDRSLPDEHPSAEGGEST